MKSSGLLLLLVLLVLLALAPEVRSQRDICTGEDGCIFAVKEYIYVPINDKSGKRDSFAESFDMKIMLAYSDRLIFFETNQTPIFQRELPPGKWLRTIFYNEITLDCGEDGNKVCLAGELERKTPKFRILPQVLNGIKDADKMCLAAPIIDNTERPPETSALYICSNNQALMRDFFRMRDKISRWADTYQMRIVEEEHSSLNAVLRKTGSFKYYSDDGKELLISLQLYFQKIRAYVDPNNFLTKVFEFGLKQIKEKDGVQTVEKALEKKIITKAVWEQFKTTHSVSGSDKCCLLFPLKRGGVLKQERSLFLCSAAEKDCEKEAQNWVVTLNTYIGRVKYLDDYETLLNHGENLKCTDDFPELNPMKLRLKNIANFQDEMCKRLSLTAVTNQAKACSKDKVDDVTEEIRMLSKYNKGIQTALENCIKFRVVDIFTMRFTERNLKKTSIQRRLQI